MGASRVRLLRPLNPFNPWLIFFRTDESAYNVSITSFLMTSLFDADSFAARHETLEDGAMLLHGFAVREARLLLDDVARVSEAAPFRHLITPGGYTMSVAMTNCGRVGWVSDRRGYRYDPIDPQTGMRWPEMPVTIPRPCCTCRGRSGVRPL